MAHVPADRIIGTISVYNIGNVPLTLPLNGFEQSTANLITASVINEIGARAQTNQVRVFAYNHFSRNTWNNNEFVELVCTVAGMLVAQLQGGSQLGTILNDTVSTTVTLVTSGLVSQFPELQAWCNPQQAQAHRENIGALMNMKATLTGSSPMTMNVPMNNNRYATPGNMIVNQPSMGASYVHPQVNMSANNMYSSSRPAAEVPAAQWEEKSRYAYMEPIAPPVTFVPPVAVMEPITPVIAKPSTKSWKPTIEQPYRQLPRLDEKVSYTELHGVITQVVCEKYTDKDFIVDRERHRILGGAVEVSPQESINSIVGDVNALYSYSPTTVNEVFTSTIPEGGEMAEHICKDIIASVSIADLVLTNRLNFRELIRDPKNKIGVYRAFGAVTTPVLSHSVPEIFARKYSNLDELATFLISTARSIAELIPSAASVADISVLESKIAFIGSYNDHVTELVNDLLTNKLSLNFKISSFTDDYTAIRPFIAKKYGDIFVGGYERAAEALVKKLFGKCPEFDPPAALEDAEEVSYIPTTYSMTFVNVSSHELDFVAQEGEVYSISPISHTWLFRLAESLFRQSVNEVIDPLVDLLITNDGKCFKLHEGVLGTGCYLISA